MISKRNVFKTRLFLASFFGGVSGFLILFSISSFTFFCFKILFGLLMIIIAFSYKNFKYTMNNFFYLIILSILLGGTLYLFNIEISKTIIGIIFKDKIIYTIMLLLISLIVTVLYAKYIIKSKQCIVNKYNVTINNDDKCLKLVGYLDTGNSLLYRRRPVLILNKDIKIDLTNKKIIYIPIATISGVSVIKCFLLKEIIINNKIFKNIYIGISNDKFHLEDTDIILNVNLKEDICERDN
jgi:hypothetical protein